MAGIGDRRVKLRIIVFISYLKPCIRYFYVQLLVVFGGGVVYNIFFSVKFLYIYTYLEMYKNVVRASSIAS